MRLPRAAPSSGTSKGCRSARGGGLAVEHNFPLDAEYEISVQAFLQSAGWDNPTGALVWCDGPRVELAYNGAPLALDEHRRIRLRVPAGTQRITAALVDVKRCSGVNEHYLGEVALGGAIAGLVIDGPYNATGAGDTPSRRAIFVCRPSSDADEAPCAARILSRLATRAFRHPVAAGSSELDRLLEFYRIGRGESGNFEGGIQYALSRLLVDPKFLYRFEREPADVAVAAVYRVSDLELASRLSFFLWSSIPDDELLEAAAADRLHDPNVLEQQVERMLADPRAQRFVVNFVGQWLRLRELDDFPSQDPEWDADLRAAFRHETELLFADALREKRDVMWLLDADYTYVNERLAAHYGLRRRARQLHAPRFAAAGQPASRIARPRQLAHDHVGAEPHVARRARSVDRAEPARRGGAEPAARRCGRLGEGSRRENQSRRRHGARAPRDASRESHVRCVSRDHGSGRARARELRSRRPLARARGRPRGECRDRSSPTARKSRARWTCAARSCRAPTRSSRR